MCAGWRAERSFFQRFRRLCSWELKRDGSNEPSTERPGHVTVVVAVLLHHTTDDCRIGAPSQAVVVHHDAGFDVHVSLWVGESSRFARQAAALGTPFVLRLLCACTEAPAAAASRFGIVAALAERGSSAFRSTPYEERRGPSSRGGRGRRRIFPLSVSLRRRYDVRVSPSAGGGDCGRHVTARITVREQQLDVFPAQLSLPLCSARKKRLKLLLRRIVPLAQRHVEGWQVDSAVLLQQWVV